ncbi:MAG: hypothetical protein DLM57_10960 [Pseudonocardiales bacterium]|nr:MAG: hypothetical protein DLM57_10960 [Pseudonocardiales bacterium]
MLCVAVGLAACDGSSTAAHPLTPASTFSDTRGTGSPAPSTPTIATTGPNVHPGEKPPVLPPALVVNLPVGADAFARYWIQALDWGYATTDSTLAKSLFAPSCTGCARFLRNFIDLIRQQHQHYRGGRIAVTGTELMPTDHHAGSTEIVDVTVQQGGLKVISASGAVIESAPQIENDVFRTWLRWDGHSWVVVDWKRVVVK